MTDPVPSLDVLLYGEPIGTLTRLGERVLFAFDEAYVGNGVRPTLSLGFKDSLGGLIVDFRSMPAGMLPFFSNLLPEGPLRHYLAARAHVDPGNELVLLSVLGRDLPGAVSLRATGAHDRSAGDGAPDAEHPEALRFSLAGTRLKLSAVDEASGELAIPPHGVGGSWIVKLPVRELDGLAENEYAMLTLARLVGIDAPAARLVDLAAIRGLPGGLESVEGEALAVERFDRLAGGGLVHVEDFAQIFGVHPQDKSKRASYVNIASVVAAEGGEGDIVELVRRLTFSVLIGNAQMHLKNWAMRYLDRRQAMLAPAYGFVSTVAYVDCDSAALAFSRTKRFDEFTQDELAHLAARARLPCAVVLETTRETVALFREHWAAQKRHLPLSARAIERIEAHLATLPIAAAGTYSAGTGRDGHSSPRVLGAAPSTAPPPAPPPSHNRSSPSAATKRSPQAVAGARGRPY